MDFISIKNLVHRFNKYDAEGNKIGERTALNGITLNIEKGSFTAILGHNGSGKSTLSKHLNALLLPTEGSVWISGYDTKEAASIWEVRQRAGMVFQNPDNQIIANVVEEDVAFGPENMGVPTPEIWKRVEESLEKTGMKAFRMKSPNKLSGGQKQRVAIAGIMAMKPQVIILDEPTAMLDPNGRKEVIKTIHELNKEEGITVLLITHYMEEVIDADRVIVMEKGEIMMDDCPRVIFTDIKRLKELRLDVPQVTELACELAEKGIPMQTPVLTVEAFTEAFMKAWEDPANDRKACAKEGEKG